MTCNQKFTEFKLTKYIVYGYKMDTNCRKQKFNSFKIIYYEFMLELHKNILTFLSLLPLTK